MTTKTRIKANNPVREAFSACSTGNARGAGRTGYYRTKGHAVNAFDAELQTFDLCLDREDTLDFPNDDGRKVIHVCNEYGEHVGLAVFTWHRMRSGRYEFIGYLA